MLTHKIHVTLDTSAGLIRDASGTKTSPAPEFILGVSSQLQITFLEAAGRSDVVDLSTAAKNVTAWEFLVAQDFSSATPLLFVADQGKIHIEDNSLIIPISTTKTNEAVVWLNDSEFKSGLFGELNGYDNNGEPIFYCLLKNLSLRQRIAPGADPSVLPDTFIDAAQVCAILASGAALEFSVDKISWHTEQQADDSYLRFRSNSSESAVWSEAIELPAGAKGEQGKKAIPETKARRANPAHKVRKAQKATKEIPETKARRANPARKVRKARKAQKASRGLKVLPGLPLVSGLYRLR